MSVTGTLPGRLRRYCAQATFHAEPRHDADDESSHEEQDGDGLAAEQIVRLALLVGAGCVGAYKGVKRGVQWVRARQEQRWREMARASEVDRIEESAEQEIDPDEALIEEVRALTADVTKERDERPRPVASIEDAEEDVRRLKPPTPRKRKR